MTTNTVVKTSAWVERVRALAPLVEKWRDAGEQERHVPRPLFEALRDAGVFSMSAPQEVGGAEADEATVLQAIEELARQDGSVGWNVMIASGAAIIASYLPAAALREVYRGGPSTVIAGALPPQGAAIPVPGGFCLTGRWTFASGCHQADWMAGTSAVMAQGTPRIRPDGRPDIRTFFLPVGEREILDTWHTSGLRGTGSHDWQVTDIFVPEERSFPILRDGPPEPGALSTRDFVAYAGPRVAAVALGIARCDRLLRGPGHDQDPGAGHEHPRDPAHDARAGGPRRGPAACRTRLPLRDRARAALRPNLVCGTQR